jgi:hypothetical protein
MVIDETTASDVRSAIRLAFGSLFQEIESEIQDGGRFMLISLDAADLLSEQDMEEVRRGLLGIMDRRIPPRAEEYSWMVNIENKGRLVDSVSGGWKRT